MEQTIGKRIVQNRKRLGLTQDQLAEQLGVTAQAVSKWETDQSAPSTEKLFKLALFEDAFDLVGIKRSYNSLDVDKIDDLINVDKLDKIVC